VTLSDLGSHFYTTPNDVGKRSRADVSLEQLKELNPYVTITVQKVALSPEEIAEFDVVVVTDIWDRNYLRLVSNAVHAK
jgi:molybdopterin/thiamine biosynthesis adenylyltransferase